MHEAVVSRLATCDAASIHRELRAVVEGVFHRVTIKVLAHVIAAIVPSANRFGFDGPRVLHPAEVIDVVDVEIAEAATARPKEAVEARNLPEQFARFAGPFFRKRRSEHSLHSITAE